MFSDFRSFGNAPATIAATGAWATTDDPSDTTGAGYMHLVAIDDVVLTAVKLKYDKTPANTYAFTLKAGNQLPAVKSLSITSGNCLILWFK